MIESWNKYKFVKLRWLNNFINEKLKNLFIYLFIFFEIIIF